MRCGGMTVVIVEAIHTELPEPCSGIKLICAGTNQ